jgi:hypothetical protein
MIGIEEWRHHRKRLLAAASLEKFADGKAVLGGLNIPTPNFRSRNTYPRY